MRPCDLIKLFHQEPKFVIGAHKINQVPNWSMPEVAFVGKSNVGKSSLINMVCRTKALAKTSKTPGRTQQINFFSIADKLALVDMPGYGYAKVPDKIRSKWEFLITNYLGNRSNLRMVNLLVDARRGIQENDIFVIKFLIRYNKNYQIVFTKMDKINNKISSIPPSSLSSNALKCNMIYTSVESKIGVQELRSSLAECIKVE